MKKKKLTSEITLLAVAISAISLPLQAAQNTSYTYHPTNGQIETIDGPRTDVNDVMSFFYDPNNNLAGVSNALGHTIHYTQYDSAGRVLQMMDANNVITDFTYTPRGWLETVTVKSPSGQSLGDSVTVFFYDAVGQVIRTEYPGTPGAIVHYEYDDARRLTSVYTDNGDRITYTLDAAGNRTSETITDISGTVQKILTQAYDELSRVMQITGGDLQVTDFSYDVNDNLEVTINGRRFPTTQRYDALNRIKEVEDAKGNIAQLGYDSQDNLETVTDQRGNTTQYFYDGFDNLLEIRSPDTGITTFTYDDANNLTTQTDAKGTTTQYFYDALNRLVSVSVVGSPELSTRYYYDDPAYFGVGRLTRIEDSVSTTAYRYDHLGNIVTTVVNYHVDGQGPTNDIITQYVYDLAGNLVETTLPSGRVVSQYRDNLGRVADVSTASAANGSSIVTGVNYLPFGPATDWTFGNGIQQVNSYDLDYRITSIALNASNDPASNYQLDFNYDPVSNITDITESGSGSFSYTYDELDRLTKADTPTAVYEYGYDEVGNRLFSSILTATGIEFQDYTYDGQSNRLFRVDNGREVRLFTYDDNGNIITDDRGDKPGVIFNYSPENRLDSVEAGVNP